MIVRRGLKRIDRKIDHSKQSMSILFCGNAVGTYLPPMVLYKAQILYTNWTVGGPTGTVYDVTKTGWFDLRTFEIWFMKVFLPNVSSLSGPILLIGDNLPSPFSTMVVNESLKNYVVFVTMPANATHLCQPKDVAVFRPAKRSWRQVMDKWRKETRSKGAIPKSQFPGLLKRLFDTFNSHNMVSGFRASGIFLWIDNKY